MPFSGHYAVREVIGAVFPPLPLTLLSPLNGLANRPNDPQAVDFIVEAPGIEADSGQPEITIEHQSGAISTDADPAHVSDRAPECASVHGVVTESSEAYELSNVVETALAKALLLAAERERWDIWVRSPPSSKPGDLTDPPHRMPSEPCAIDEPEHGYLAIGRSP